MCANKINVDSIKHELSNSAAVRACAERHSAVSDLSAMKVCYLLRHYPDLSVSAIAELVGLSVSATSRCLTKLKAVEIVTSSKVAQTVHYRLNTNSFTNELIKQFGLEG